MSPQELQLTANFLYLSYAIALVESKVRQFSIPISRLNQSIRRNIAAYENTADDLVMLKTLIDRLSYVIGARSIYIETLKAGTNHYNKNSSPTINAALENIQYYAQMALCSWANEKADKTTEKLKKSSEVMNESVKHFQEISNLHKEMSKGIIPIKIPKEHENHQSLFILTLILNNNPELLTMTEEITNALNETSDHAAQIITAGAEIYKQYYKTVYNLIAAPTHDKHYATTMFGMHDVLPEEYKSLLPDADHVFEHMLQTTKLYTQTELLQQQ